MPARKKSIQSAKPKSTRPPRGKLQAVPASGKTGIAGLTPEVSAMVEALMVKDAAILEALREA